MSGWSIVGNIRRQRVSEEKKVTYYQIYFECDKKSGYGRATQNIEPPSMV